jgi:nucleotide-binding universal stress UspA family protein
MFKNIMLAVDGSAYTDAVLSHGIELAKHFSSHLMVLTVADVRIFEWASAVGSDGFISIVPSGSYQDASRSLLEEKCDKILARCAELLQESQVAFSVEKSIGAPVDIILEQAQVADLLVMGKRGEFARWDNKALGATVESVSRMVRKPLLVVKQEFQHIKKILIGYDGSDHANRALQYAAHIAEAAGGSVGVVCVTDDSELSRHYCGLAHSYLKNYHLAVSEERLAGHPDEVLVKYASENQYDLIAIGAYGHSRMREALLGSTTDHILRKAECPVLLAK